MNGFFYSLVGFDADSRITGYTHNQSAYDQTFGYDNLNRLSAWTGNGSTQAFGYDLTGNRTSLTIGGSSYPYTVQGTSNRVTQTAGPGGTKSFGFDTAGNTTTAGTLSFSYDGRGRMTGGTTLLGAATYQINALGQRVAKAVAGTTTHFHYDASGSVIAESDAAGATTTEYVWLATTPVALLRANTAYFVHADHLDTPRVVTNQSNTIVWRWDSDPFGVTGAQEDPDGDTQLFTQNLRFPGQYFDKESNLHYNYYRDYDPQIGRYIQSDPIGLESGVNTYAYVDDNPLTAVDPLGLFKAKPGDDSVYPPTANCSCTLACMASPDKTGYQFCKWIPSKRIIIRGVPITANPARWLCETLTKGWACEDLCSEFCRGDSPTNPMSCVLK